MKELTLINPENALEEEVKNYRVREAARAVVVDEDGMVVLLHVSKDNYYKLPGGGIEDTEDKITALQRECQEEIGCDIEVINEIGFIVEYKKIYNLKQISYCYFAKVNGQKGTPRFTDEEVAEGFKEVWLCYEDAKCVLAETRAANFEGSAYIVLRDSIFLEEAKDYLTDLRQ
jgi:8-oxo-dGTP pyrophosphatase MutT (NUDIX family)